MLSKKKVLSGIGVFLIASLCLPLIMAPILSEVTSSTIEGSFPTIPSDLLSKEFDIAELRASGKYLNPNAANWVPFIPGALPGTAPDVYVQSSDYTRIVVATRFYGMWSGNRTIGTDVYSVHAIPSCGHLSDVGSPELPVVTKFVEVPPNVDVTVEVLHRVTRRFSGCKVTPFIGFYPSATGSSNTTSPWFPPPSNFTDPPINSTVYSFNRFIPLDNVWLSGGLKAHPIYLRGRRIVGINIVPILFHPQNSELEAHSSLTIALNYDKQASIPVIEERFVSRVFEELFQSFLLNYHSRARSSASAQLTSSKMAMTDEGVDYLIITDEAFIDELQPLISWKMRKGLQTRCITVQQIVRDDNQNPDTISPIEKRRLVTEYINDTYWGETPAPSYVLFVGDDEHIVPHYEYQHYAAEHAGAFVGSDLGYFTVDGDDYIPDILYGRFSVDTPQETRNLVSKTLDYEKDPPARSSHFYDYITPVAYSFITDPARSFFLSANNVSEHLSNFYEIDTVYRSFPNFDVEGTKVDIRSAFNDGRLMIYYVGHGASENFQKYVTRETMDGWSNPIFTTRDFTGLDNDGMYPLVVSIACCTGWFDGNTDCLGAKQGFEYLLEGEYESFCENITRLGGSGAIAAIGATRMAEFWAGDALFDGMIDCMWPDYRAASAFGVTPTLGQMLWYGKMFMATYLGLDSRRTEITYHMYHLFGDPELKLWRDAPGTLTVEHPEGIGSMGEQSFYVKVTNASSGQPVESATVSLQMDDLIVKFDSNSYGYAYCYITPSQYGGVMNITVTHSDFKPYLNEMTVTPHGGYLELSLNEADANYDLTLTGYEFDYGAVDIDFGGHELRCYVDVATQGEFVNSFDVFSGVESPVNIVANQFGGNKLAVTLFGRLDDHADPYIYSQWDEDTWALYSESKSGHPRWDNPDIELRYLLPVGGYEVPPETTHTLHVTVHNKGHATARGVTVSLYEGEWGIGQQSWRRIKEWINIQIPGKRSHTLSTTWSTLVAGSWCFRAEISYDQDENIDNNIGLENLAVQTVTTPGTYHFKFPFSIYNPNAEKISFDSVNLLERELRENQLVQIEREASYVFSPPHLELANLSIVIPAEVPYGETQTYVVTATSDGRVYGGIEVIIHKFPIEIPRISDKWLLGFLVLLILIIIVIILSYFVIRSLKSDNQSSDKQNQNTGTSDP